MSAYCPRCMTQCAVTERRFDYHTLMLCHGCGLWIKCPKCMAIRAIEHTCKET